MTTKFWIVVSDQRGPADWPMRHPSEESAFAEAERLARIGTGKFFVLEAKGAAVKKDVVTVRFGDDDQIPF